MSLSRKVYAPLPPHANEAELMGAVLAQLAPWFSWLPQVGGTHCSGRRMRIDVVAWPRDAGAWKDEKPVFGIEFKAVELRTFDTKNFTAWAAQAVDYAHVDWDGFGRIMVFTCPSPTSYFEIGEPEINAASIMSRLLWQLGVGELANLERDGWTLLGQGEHVLWSERRGVHEAGRWSFNQKLGSR